MNILRAVGLGRLTQVANWMEEYAPFLEGRINLSVWRADDDRPCDIQSTMIDDFELLEDCGTVGCIIGWVSAVPEFKSQGLRMGLSPFYDPHSVIPFNMSTSDIYQALLYEHAPPHTKGIVVGAESIKHFFQVTPDEFIELFTESAYEPAEICPAGIVKRLRNFVARQMSQE